MGLKKLDIHQFRNLETIQLHPSPRINYIFGENGAGKTNLLESIYYLSYGRSFRQGQTRDLIQHHQSVFRLVAETAGPREHHIGLERRQQEQIIRVDRQNVKTMAEVSALFPVLAIHPDSHQLLNGGPEYRRQFLDWGVFHVKHDFIQHWRQYRKALSQRNAALRQSQNARLCQSWDTVLLEHAGVIEDSRKDYLETIRSMTNNLAEQFFPSMKIVLQYRPGVAEGRSLAEHLEKQLDQDLNAGYTQAGPHRADIRILVDDYPAYKVLSRGQQKKLITLLKLSQLRVFAETTQETCILLYDDLPAELDKSNRNLLLDQLHELNVQTFITAISPQQMDLDEAVSDASMFHVKHGRI